LASTKSPKTNDAPATKPKLPVLSFLYIILALGLASAFGYGYYTQINRLSDDPTADIATIAPPVEEMHEAEKSAEASSDHEKGMPEADPTHPTETEDEHTKAEVEDTTSHPETSTEEEVIEHTKQAEETVPPAEEANPTEEALDLKPDNTPVEKEDSHSAPAEESKPKTEEKHTPVEAKPVPDKTPEAPVKAEPEPAPKKPVSKIKSETPTATEVGSLPPAPVPELTAKSEYGLLPVISPDGRLPWRVYARPFDDPLARPRIAIIIGDMGMSQFATRSSIQNLPGEVTLSFNPYGRDLQNWVSQARAAGHETLLQLPMEPFGYPKNDPGPQSLLSRLTDKENLTRLEWMLSRFAGYAGVTNQMGSKFTTSRNDIAPVLDIVKERGLLFLDGRTSGRSVAGFVAKEKNIPVAINNRFIDNRADRASIDQRLKELEKIARSTGSAVGIGYPYPVTLERVANWAKSLNRKGLVLSPLSAVTNRQEIQ